MKNILFLLFTIITIPSFSQDVGNRGTIKVKKVVADTGCVASVLGYTGKNFITKAELSKAKKIDLNKKCDFEIIESIVSYLTRERSVKYAEKANTLNMEKILKREGGMELPRITINMIAKSKSSGKEIQLPPIIFELVKVK